MLGSMSAIWALVGHGEWKAKAVHWNHLDYPAEKNKSGTKNERKQPDFIGDICTPDGQPITNATVEGRLLKVDFKPFIVSGDNQKTSSHTFTFIIDPLAEKGPQGKPDYPAGELARLAGWASHVNKTVNPNTEVVKPIYRDNFVRWGHLEQKQGGKVSVSYDILPMYFIPHGKSITNFTEPRDDFTKFGKGNPGPGQWQVVPLMEGEIPPEGGAEEESAANAEENEGGFVMATAAEEEAAPDDGAIEQEFQDERAKEAEEIDNQEKADEF